MDTYSIFRISYIGCRIRWEKNLKLRSPKLTTDTEKKKEKRKKRGQHRRRRIDLGECKKKKQMNRRPADLVKRGYRSF
ncbi:hypothetical protein CCACVL1_19253 [Corchorus capsularis]|uniref:Uncharacterized protein n=1 Tax=Corchorus capsularis TaxID=210143 RepID=A0A1R3HHF1_COCAP|nr:hypothetical protein CCACVL1_19253 [Corchorus capsularis]